MTNDDAFRGEVIDLIAQEELSLPTGERILVGARIQSRQDIEDSPVRYCYPAQDVLYDITDLVSTGQLKLDQHS